MILKRTVFFVTVALFVIGCNSKQERKPYETECVEPKEKRIQLYKEVDALMKSSETIIEANYPKDLENRLKENDPAIKAAFYEAFKKYEDFERRFDDSLFTVVSNQHNITSKCLDSIWWEGANENWHNLNQ